MSLLQQKRPVFNVLTQADSYPYTPTEQMTGLSVANDGADTVTVVVNDGTNDITINVTTSNPNYDANFKAIRSINVTAGTTYQIELRGLT